MENKPNECLTSDVSKAASLLGKLGKGKPKTISKAGREQRRLAGKASARARKKLRTKSKSDSGIETPET